MGKLDAVQPTYDLGGLKEPSGDELAKMQASDYILHARDGQLTKIPAQKATLPYDPFGHTQRVEIARAPDGAIYVNQTTVMSKSIDGGLTWQGYETCDHQNVRDGQLVSYDMVSPIQILSDGTFVGTRSQDKTPDQVEILVSRDEWRTREPVAEVGNPSGCPERFANTLCRLEDDTLLLPIESRYHWHRDPTYVHRSTDGGRTWSGPEGMDCGQTFLGGFCYENMIAPMASGKLLAVIRYHGPLMECWPVVNPKKVPQYKTVFLADSEDGGLTWHNLRPLTNVHGMCHGFGVGLSDGTAVVSHDHRYPPGTPSGKARVSRDEGATWEDEVYYLYHNSAQSGFSQSVVLDDDVILTVGAHSDCQEGLTDYDAWTGRTTLTAIRWKLK